MREITTANLPVVVAQHDRDLANLKETFDDHENRQNSSLDNVWRELRAIRSELIPLIAGRPTWAVAIIMSALATLSGSLIVWVVTH